VSLVEHGSEQSIYSPEILDHREGVPKGENNSDTLGLRPSGRGQRPRRNSRRASEMERDRKSDTLGRQFREMELGAICTNGEATIPDRYYDERLSL